MQHAIDPPVAPLPANAPPSALEGTASVHLALAGVGCANCANRIRNALLRTPGVLEVEVLPDGAVVRVWRDPAVPVKTLVAAVVAAGEGTPHAFAAVPIRSRF